MYEVNANNKSFSSKSATAVAKVAVAWKKAGLQPQAYAISNEDGVKTRQVEITTVRETAKKLAG